MNFLRGGAFLAARFLAAWSFLLTTAVRALSSTSNATESDNQPVNAASDNDGDGWSDADDSR